MFCSEYYHDIVSQVLTTSGALGAWCPLVNLLARDGGTVLRLTVLRFPLVGC